MPKQALTLNDFSGGINDVKDARDIAKNQLRDIDGFMVDKQGALRTIGGLAAHEEIETQENATTAKIKGGVGLAVLESDYETEAKTFTATTVIDFSATRVLCSFAISSIQVHVPTSLQMYVTLASASTFTEGDNVVLAGTTGGYYDGIYEIQSGSDSTHLVLYWISDYGDTGASGNANIYWEDHFNAGEEIVISNTSLNNGFYTISYISTYFMYMDGLAVELNTSAIISSFPRNEILLLNSDAPNGTIDTYSKNQDTWTVDQITLDTTSGNMPNDAKAIYHSVDGAIRACDAEFDNTSTVKWFGLIKRTHFEGANDPTNGAIQRYYDWYEKDNKLSPPTYGKNAGAAYPTATLGFNIAATMAADDNSTWEAATYELAFSFIYDGIQESLLYQAVTPNHTFIVEDGEKVSIVVRAQKTSASVGYDERISGGRVYARVSGSDDAWFMLADIDMRLGARSTFNSKYTAWTTVSTTTTSTGSVDSLSQNIDTYENINGYSHKDSSNSIGDDGEAYKTSVVASRRAFIANVRRKDPYTGELKTYADRIYYSQPGQFDTFPENNFVDVVIGDSESYVALAVYADRLLAFKEKTLHIINISSGSDSSWFIESKNKFMGVEQQSAITDTEFGPCWINDSGCYLYQGQGSPINLIGDKLQKIEDRINKETWNSFVGPTSMIGYVRSKKQLIIVKDALGLTDTSGDCYIYDFGTQSWTFASNLLPVDKTNHYVSFTNFIQDWNGDLVVGRADSDAGTVTYYKWSDTSVARTGLTLTTKDEDFGDLLHVKKVYKVYITYKSSVDQLTPLEYSVDGTNSFSDFASGSNVSPAGDDSGDLDAGIAWDIGIFTPTSPVTCQSVQFKVNPPSSGTFDINDITIEYRIISKRVS